jgi:histidinol dehydrogenase
MQTIINPDRALWPEILKRPLLDFSGLYKKVEGILNDIKQNGDEALLKYTMQFDGLQLKDFKITDEEMELAEEKVDRKVKEAIKLAYENIKTFHLSQVNKYKKIETMPGVTCWQKAVPIEKAGLYIPGGSAPLFSTVLMLAIPAKIAGCSQVILCTPPGKDGEVNPVILYAAKLAGVREIYKLGGVQAIGAMAYGTESVPKADKIFGPGNQFVTAAKQLVSMNSVAIDMPAGPSEVMVVADQTANPSFVAADLLSQAEHGTDSQVILVTDSAELAGRITKETILQLENLPRKEFAEKSLQNSMIIVMENKKETIDLINTYAPEHLILSVSDYNETAAKIINAGSVFLGNYTPESAGDYASGTNHTLPTNGWAKAYSGVNLDSFMKKITFQEITAKGLEIIGPAIEILAQTEQLGGHKQAVSVRLNEIHSNKINSDIV